MGLPRIVVAGVCALVILLPREWRNWQTRQVEGLVVVIPCRFKSCFPQFRLFSPAAIVRRMPRPTSRPS